MNKEQIHSELTKLIRTKFITKIRDEIWQRYSINLEGIIQYYVEQALRMEKVPYKKYLQLRKNRRLWKSVGQRK